ncbi:MULTISPECIES: hypothetical protein [unclassified Rathayibacter]|uniref:hypothetical protein n=1 Tax=unclassified Rathayibacter TaxID=2609250 RepID=UPI000CE811D1|nr:MULTISPECIES: hypothetical protein [unclassified Rathayibacter]PPG06309.1 hypothetical protein C5C26_11930 [Rathayibacter sp. AY2B1]PPG73665.1 hypothetical protein C5C59_01015 [Rathayibacter sp. AY1F4]
MKKVLLLSERFSTIAPRGFRPADAIAEMKERGWWLPAHRDDLDEVTRERAVRECIDASGRSAYGGRLEAVRPAFRCKLPDELEHWLLANDYLRPSSRDGSQFRATRENLVLAICGWRLSQTKGGQYGVATTATAKQALFAIDDASDQRALALSLHDIPEPHPNATFDEIVTFRQSKEMLLARSSTASETCGSLSPRRTTAGSSRKR